MFIKQNSYMYLLEHIPPRPDSYSHTAGRLHHSMYSEPLVWFPDPSANIYACADLHEPVDCCAVHSLKSWRNARAIFLVHQKSPDSGECSQTGESKTLTSWLASASGLRVGDCVRIYSALYSASTTRHSAECATLCSVPSPVYGHTASGKYCVRTLRGWGCRSWCYLDRTEKPCSL